ncbi:uncharacterized protein LOC108110040 isoform X2 [Drosophila eugracilis]|uniref:uncharacterized protein LOC108110040 isoform X2 n=1 Tax=Drosophila eugracilis TaxID=29029 RepID=UPI0007E7BA7E|nr:uncharacterized protein LOC108110040 isoform X2 [Drosophila eugracilis]
MFCEEVAMELLNPEVNYKPEVKIRTQPKPKWKAELVISDKRKGTSAVDPYAEVKGKPNQQQVITEVKIKPEVLPKAEHIRQPNRMVKPQTKEVMPEDKAKVEPQPKYKLFLVTNPKVMLDASTKVVDQTPKTRMPNQETKLKQESNQETEVILALPFRFKAAVRTVREAKEIIREAKSKDIPVVVREVKVVNNLKSGIKIESEGEPVSRLQHEPEVIKLRKPDGNILKSKEHVVISQPEQKSKLEDKLYLESKSIFQSLGKSVDEQKSQYKTKFIRQTEVDNPKKETKIETEGKPNLKMISIPQNIPRTKEAVISYLRNKSQFVAEPNLETMSISPTSGKSGKDHKLKDVIKAGGDVKAELYVNRSYPETMSEFKRHTDKADIPKPETKTDLKDKSNLQIISEFKDILEVILQSQQEVRLHTKESVICKPEKKPKLVTELNLQTLTLLPISIMPREKICVEVAVQTDSDYAFSNADVISEVKRQTNEANLRSEWILEDIEEGLWQEYKDKAKIKSIFQPSFHLIDEIQAKDKFNSDVTKKGYSYEDLVKQQHKEVVMSKLDNKSKLKAKLSAEMLSINQKVTKAFEEFKFLNESTHFYDYKLQLGGMSEVIRPTYGTKSKPRAVEEVF